MAITRNPTIRQWTVAHEDHHGLLIELWDVLTMECDIALEPYKTLKFEAGFDPTQNVFVGLITASEHHVPPQAPQPTPVEKNRTQANVEADPEPITPLDDLNLDIPSNPGSDDPEVLTEQIGNIDAISEAVNELTAANEELLEAMTPVRERLDNRLTEVVKAEVDDLEDHLREASKPELTVLDGGKSDESENPWWLVKFTNHDVWSRMWINAPDRAEAVKLATAMALAVGDKQASILHPINPDSDVPAEAGDSLGTDGIMLNCIDLQRHYAQYEVYKDNIKSDALASVACHMASDWDLEDLLVGVSDAGVPDICECPELPA